MATDNRRGIRKVLRVPAILLLDGERPVKIRTNNIGTEGLGIVVPHQVQEGKKGQIHFRLFLDGKTSDIVAHIKVVHCVFSGAELKAGLLFSALDKPAAEVVSKFMNT